MPLPRLTRSQIADALEGAARARREREVRGEREPLEDWPDGPPPAGDKEAMERYLSALRQWHEAHAGAVTEAEWQAVRAQHELG